jgi:hypothetical protein
MTIDGHGMFDQSTLKELRYIITSVRERRGLEPATERYGLEFSMNRLAELVCTDLHPREAEKSPVTKIENIDEFAEFP